MNDQLTGELDEKIREALRREDADLLKHYQSDPSLHEMLIETFRGRHRWMNVLAFLFTFAGLAMVGVAAYQFFDSDSTRAMIAWAACFLLFVVWIAMLKLWFWLEIQRLFVTREIKRLELQIANLSRQLEQRKQI